MLKGLSQIQPLFNWLVATGPASPPLWHSAVSAGEALSGQTFVALHGGRSNEYEKHMKKAVFLKQHF